MQPLVARVNFTFVFLTRRRGYQRATRGSLQSKVINAFTIIVFLILVKMITFLDKSDARVSYDTKCKKTAKYFTLTKGV